MIFPDSPSNSFSEFSKSFGNFYYLGFNSLYYNVSWFHKLHLFHFNYLNTNKLDFKGTHKESQDLSMTKTYSVTFNRDAELSGKK